MPQLYENAKLLVCCADSLFGLDVRSFGCVVLSSLHVPLRTVFHKSLLYLPQVRMRYAMTFFWFFLACLSVSRDGDIYDVLSVSALGPNRT